MIDNIRHFRFASKAWCAWLVLAIGLAGGCTRTHYRLQADKEVRCLIKQKSNDPRWAYPDFPVNIDPRARFWEPTNPDFPPMPQDDPASHRFMVCVDGKRGYPCWNADGIRKALESPQWRELMSDYAEITPQGRVKMPLRTAVLAGLVNSPAYRSQIEDLYLSALDVSTERFRFDVQFFGNNETAFTHRGEAQTAAGELNTLQTDTNFIMRKRFATGADLLVQFANSFVWQFTGPDTNSTSSLLSFNFVQPLLRAGGRAVALEQLTIVERTLLANLRAFQRYRQGFYTNIAIGDGGVQGPQRRGGFLGGTGLTGFSGAGSSGFGEVGQATGLGRIGGNNNAGGGAAGGTAGFAGGGAGTVGGFIGLLQQLQQVRNTQDSLNAQIRTVGLLEANLDAGLIDIAQVDQFRQNIETERANLLAAQVGLANSVEVLKVANLGLPPDLPVELDDSMIQQFRLVDPQTTAVQTKIEDFIALLGNLPKVPSKEDLESAFEVFEKLRRRVDRQFTAAEADLKELQDRLPDRLAAVTEKDAKQLKSELEKLDEVMVDLKTRFNVIGVNAQQASESLAPDELESTTDRLVNLSSSLSGLTQELSLVQARARLESVSVNEVKLAPDRALEVARANRLDWMNNRAALVDTWRLIAFNVNALRAGLDIVFSGDLGTVGNNAVAFNGRNGALRAGVRFDAPFTRLVERNNYRQALINYQQDRRQLIQFEDTTNLALRRILRQLEQLRLNLEIQRRAVVIAVRRVDQTRENLNQPPAPIVPGQTAVQFGPTAAQNLLTALSDLRNAQNNFMSVWLNHYALRMQLARELGVMEIDNDGLWVERPEGELQHLPEVMCPMPHDIPAEWQLEAAIAYPGPAAAWQTITGEIVPGIAPLNDDILPPVEEEEDREALPPGMPVE